jgi:uridine kinase
LAPAGREIIRASIDGFHRPRADRYRQGADSARGYYEDSFDHDALRRALVEPLGPGGDRRYRTAVFDFRTDSPVDAPVREAAADAVLVLDGVFLQRPELHGGWELEIFVAVDPEERLRRTLERDLDLFGSPEEVERRYRARYLPGQLLYLADARPLDHADFVVTNDDPARPELSAR